MVQGLTVSVLTDWSGILVPNEIISGNPDYKSGLFCIFAPLFRRETRQRFFIEKKACFRLSVNVNLDNSFCMYGLRKSSLPIEYFVNQVGLIFQCLTYRESKPYVEDAETIGLHFFVVGIW